MLDHRVYRAAFLPALVALFVVAFSLSDPASPRTTRLAPDYFDAGRAFGRAEPPPRNSMRELAASFPRRRPGSAGDTGLADRVASAFEASGFAAAGGVKRDAFTAETIDGRRDIEDVVATRQGLSSRAVVVIAHRDAPKGPATADLSGTATLIELSRLFADRDLRKTVVLASVSGGSGGYAGARRVLRHVDGEVDAVYVLGDLASRATRRPFVVPWSNRRAPAPYGLERTAESALRHELAGEPGRDRASVQWIRRAFPLSLSEQGVLGAAGVPAVLVSAYGERRPPADAPVSYRRYRTFGRAVLRMLTATLDAGGIEADPPERQGVPTFPGGQGIVLMDRLVPQWALRLLVLTLLLPALLTAFDAFFRARRRGLPVGRWLAWVGGFMLAPLIAWGWSRALAAIGGVTALPAPAAGGVLALTTGGILAMVSALVVFLGVAFGLRPLLLRGVRPRGSVAAGGAAAATGLGLAVLVGAVWVVNPYAAGVLLPAAHAWLLVTAPAQRMRWWTAVAGSIVGLLLPMLVIVYYAHAWGLGPVEGLWTAFGLVAGGVLGVLQAVVLSAFLAAFCATVLILRAGGRAAASAPAERIVTRGPRSYAGPGSLGGTESALRP